MLENREISASLAKITKEKFNENDDRKKKDIAMLREWLQKQPHLIARTDEQFLLNFLRGCKFSLERVKRKLEIYYTSRAALPQFFKNRSIKDPQMQQLLRLSCLVVLPKPNGEDGPRVLIARPGCYDADQYRIQEIMPAMSMITDYMMLLDDNQQVSGYQLVGDAAGVKTGHVFQYDPMFMKQMSTFYQDALPAVFKGGFIINASVSLEKFINWGKTFLNEKNRSRINIIGSNLDKLYEHIPKKLFPAEYGGDAGTIDQIINDWIEKLKAKADLLKEEEMYGTDESKRSKNLKNADGLFGTVGSFRTLNLD